jgi:hypothetical protein
VHWHARSIDFEEIMSFSYRLIAATLASMPLAAVAQIQTHHTDPTDANATVPASKYESAFKAYQPDTDEKQPPDEIWRAANDEVRGLGGHAGHVQDAGTRKAPAKLAPAAHHQAHVHPASKEGKP